MEYLSRKQEKALGSQSLPHARHIGRQSRPFGDFQPFSILEFMGSDFKFGVGVRGRNCKKCRFYGIFAGVVHRSYCRSKSEFIEKAVLFYLGYLSSKDNEEYFSSVITSTLKAVVDESDNRIGRMIFKLAVELAITMNIIASAEDIDKDSLERLRGECVREVRRLNGSFSFKDAYEWQKE